jgi:hypothetical protein
MLFPDCKHVRLNQLVPVLWTHDDKTIAFYH